MVEEHVLYSIPYLRGTYPGDHELISDYLYKYNQNKDNRVNKDPSNIRWQDIEIPVDAPDIINDIIKYINTSCLDYWKCNKIEYDKPWAIVNGPLEQTYPHRHGLLDNEWAVVYWAQAPENCGNLEIYPQGLDKRDTITRVFEPVAGDFLVFPGYLLHGVRHNASNQDRINLSYNIRAI